MGVVSIPFHTWRFEDSLTCHSENASRPSVVLIHAFGVRLTMPWRLHMLEKLASSDQRLDCRFVAVTSQV